MTNSNKYLIFVLIALIVPSIAVYLPMSLFSFLTKKIDMS